MKKTKYIKYNRTRREEFQIRTCIVEEDGNCLLYTSPSPRD